MNRKHETLRQKLNQQDPYLLTEIGKRIRKERIAAGFKSQAALMEAMGFAPESRQTVANWESGKKLPDLDRLLWMCDHFNCEMGYLLCEEGYECKSRAVTDIQKETGLSEKAIEQILILKEVDEQLPRPGQLNMLNRVLKNMVDFSGLLAQMSLYLKVINGEPPNTDTYSKKVLEKEPDAKPIYDSHYLSEELRKMGWVVVTPKEFSREKFEDCTKMLKKLLDKMATDQKEEDDYGNNN